MLGQRRRHWANIKTTLDQYIVFAGGTRRWSNAGAICDTLANIKPALAASSVRNNMEQQGYRTDITSSRQCNPGYGNFLCSVTNYINASTLKLWYHFTEIITIVLIEC